MAAQNVLLQKLGISVDAPPEANDYNQYVRAFAEGLMEEQVRMIDELFACQIPPADEHTALEELEGA